MQALKELVQMYENEIYKNLSKPGFFINFEIPNFIKGFDLFEKWRGKVC